MATRQIGIIGQVRTASKSPTAAIVGAALGGFVPVATYAVAHKEAALWNPSAALVAGGLVYSAKTVWQWGRLAFACPWKATGFVLLLEGVMVLSRIEWLSVAALAYLVGINATATACLLARSDRPIATATATKPRRGAKSSSTATVTGLRVTAR